MVRRSARVSTPGAAFLEVRAKLFETGSKSFLFPAQVFGFLSVLRANSLDPLRRTSARLTAVRGSRRGVRCR